MRLINRKLMLLSFVLTFAMPALLHAGGPGFDRDVKNWHDDDDDDDDDNNNDIPLDGGLSFLAAAGAALGIKKIRDNISGSRREK